MSLFVKRPKPWNEYMATGETNIADVHKRAKERLTFMGIDQEALQTIKDASELLIPHKAQIVKKFYGAVMEVGHLKQLINQHSTVERLQKTMQLYLEQFLKAEIDDAYIQTRIIVGKVHSRIHLTADHFISAHHLLLQSMTTIIMENLHRSPDLMIRTTLAIQRLAAFDQQLIVEVYMEETFKSFLFGVSDMLNHTTQLDTTGQLIKSMHAQIEESHSVSAATDQMSASIQEVAVYAVKVAEDTEEAVHSAEQSKHVINQSLGAIQHLGRVYDEVLDQINQLNSEIEHTQNVVSIIRGIADQTNLLALNAGIEAARAGEHGRGFSIVASEVRKLAEHSKEQISQITANMESLQRVSNQVTSQMSNTGKLVEQSVQEARTADDALERITSLIQGVNHATSQIAAMAEEQTSSVADIAHRNSVIFDLSASSQAVAEQTAKLVLELSKQMDTYRNSFFQINVNFSSKDTIQIAITDHLLWKWKVYNMLLGIETLNPNEVASYEGCRLGQWYYSNLPASIKGSKVYLQLELPHKAVHHNAKIAIEKYTAGDLLGAQQAFDQLQVASKEVIALLEQLQAEL